MTLHQSLKKAAQYIVIFHLVLSSAIVPASITAQTVASVSGVVFRDFNANGIRELPAELGVANIQVRAVDINGQVQSTYTNQNGTYTLQLIAANPYRIEFDNITPGYSASAHGPESMSTIRFVTAPQIVNLGINHPDDFSPVQTSSIKLATSTWYGPAPSNQMPIATQASTMVFSRNNAINAVYDGAYDQMPHTRAQALTQVQQTGPTGSMVFDRTNQRLFLATIARRGMNYGPGKDQILNTGDDAGAIYVVKPFDNGQSVEVLSVPNAGPSSPTPRGINGQEFGLLGLYWTYNCNTVAQAPYQVPSWTHDSCAFDIIGKQALGGLAIDSTQQILYVVNLFNRHLYAFDLKHNNINQIQASIRDIGPLTGGDFPNCDLGEWRPNALKWFHGALYVGGVCSGEYTSISQGNYSLSDANSRLRTYVFQIADPLQSLSAKQIYNAPLNYARSRATSDITANVQWMPWISDLTNWQNWVTASDGSSIQHGSPMLVDIEFDSQYNLILGFADRNALNHSPSAPFVNANGSYSNLQYSTAQTRSFSHGDLRRACWIPGSGSQQIDAIQGEWVSENSTGCASTQISNNIYEFFLDNDPAEYHIRYHYEISQGYLAYLPSAHELANASTVPTTTPYSSAGIRFYNQFNGQPTEGFNTYVGKDLTLGLSQGLLDKGASMGDVAYLLPVAPIEIGDRVWADTNNNGIQDPGEVGLANVLVELFDNNNQKIGQTLSNAQGYYLFSEANTNTPIQANTQYSIRISLQQTRLRGQAASQINPTFTHINSDGNTSLFPSYSSAIIQTSEAGINIHNVDFGFTPLFTVGDTVWEDKNNNGRQDANEQGLPNIPVRLYRDTNRDGIPDGDAIASTHTNAQGKYSFSNLLEGWFIVEITPPAGFISSTGSQLSKTGPYEPSLQSASQDNYDQGTTVGKIIRSPYFGLFTEYINNPNAMNQLEWVDFGLFRPVSIGDEVWHDLNGDGLRDPQEPGLAGVTIDLFNSYGQRIGTTKTDSLGFYQFSTLSAGRYQIGIRPQELLGWELSPIISKEIFHNNDILPDTARSIVFYVSDGDYLYHIDVGLVQAITIFSQTNSIPEQQDPIPESTSTDTQEHSETEELPTLIWQTFLPFIRK